MSAGEDVRAPDAGEKVLVAHPRMQHAQHVAERLFAADRLLLFVTTFALCRGSRYYRLLELCPSSLRKKIKAALGKRVVSNLPERKVRSLGRIEFFAALLSKLRIGGGLSASLALRAERDFIRNASRLIQELQPGIVFAFDDTALPLFRVAREQGSICVLDQTTGHLSRTRKVMREEARLHPALKEYLPKEPEDKIRRACEEAAAADIILCASRYVRESIEALGVASDKLYLLPYGVDTSAFQPAATDEPIGLRFVFVGRLTPAKGVHYLLEAFSQLSDPSYRLALIGAPSGSWPMESCSDPRVEFLGVLPREKLIEELHRSHIFVFPSLHEGSAITVYEALACGLPVIATLHTGVPFENGSAGFIVPIRDSVALAARMEELAEDAALRRRMAQEARACAEAHSWERYGKRLQALLSELLEQKRKTKNVCS